MRKTLATLGFKKQDAEVYVCLALKEPKKAREIATALERHKSQVYRSLKRLQNKEIVNVTPEFPASFSAIPFDKYLDLMAKANLEDARRIEQEKDGILKLWKSIAVFNALGNDLPNDRAAATNICQPNNGTDISLASK